MNARRYRKKPVEIEAIQWTGHNWDEIAAFLASTGEKGLGRWGPGYPEPERLRIYNTPERQWINCPYGHFVIRGVQNEFYPCAPDIFEAIYEPAPVHGDER